MFAINTNTIMKDTEIKGGIKYGVIYSVDIDHIVINRFSDSYHECDWGRRYYNRWRCHCMYRTYSSIDETDFQEKKRLIFNLFSFSR